MSKRQRARMIHNGELNYRSPYCDMCNGGKLRRLKRHFFHNYCLCPKCYNVISVLLESSEPRVSKYCVVCSLNVPYSYKIISKYEYVFEYEHRCCNDCWKIFRQFLQARIRAVIIMQQFYVPIDVIKYLIKKFL